jgi:selenocysteine-specific elongation factor
MVAGATGVDLFLLVVAADDGVMPQTVEHAAVLAALAIDRGVVAVTKADVADPARAAAEARALLGSEADLDVVACSSRTGEGVAAVAAALDRAAAALPGRGSVPGDPLLHVDRSFTIRGAGTVVTGTLWSGAIARGDTLAVLPAGRRVRVRGVEVHDARVERAEAGQRVALNLVGLDRGDVVPGDVVAAPGAVAPTHILDAALALRGGAPGARVHVHHGTRETPGRLVALGGDLWQARVERPLLARAGDHLVVRSIAPPDTLGGGVVLDPHARHHGPGPEVVARLERLRAGEAPAPPEPAPPAPAPHPPELTPGALALEQRLRAAGHEPPDEDAIGAPADLAALRAAGRAVRVGRAMYAHPDAIDEVRRRVVAIVEAEGAVTLGRLRDELGTSRKYAQALLEHLDAARVTRRLPDDSRVLRRRA